MCSSQEIKDLKVLKYLKQFKDLDVDFYEVTLELFVSLNENDTYTGSSYAEISSEYIKSWLRDKIEFYKKIPNIEIKSIKIKPRFCYETFSVEDME